MVSAAAAADCASSSEAGCSTSSSADSAAAGDWVHFFGDTRHLQSTADQVGLATQTGPLPITLSGNVQSWTSGPPLGDLYTESAQASFKIDKAWTILGQQLYQQQGSITLANLVGGVNAKPSQDLSINMLAGVGIHTLYTYQWSLFLSPQLRLPWVVSGQRRVALEADSTFEHYELGHFVQVTPKIDMKIASWFPQLQVGYAFGQFENDGTVSSTQYYQPQALRGATVTAVFRPATSVFAVASLLPSNKNYIAGTHVVQSTIGGTIHWNIADWLRLSFYGEDSWYSSGSDRALGGGLGFAF